MIVYRLFVPGHPLGRPYPRGTDCGPSVRQVFIPAGFSNLAATAFRTHSVLELTDTWPVLVFPRLPRPEMTRGHYETVSAAFYGVPVVYRPCSATGPFRLVPWPWGCFFQPSC